MADRKNTRVSCIGQLVTRSINGGILTFNDRRDFRCLTLA